MTLPLDPKTRAIVLDIEGTTTPVSFVHDVLFPYARQQLRSYLSAHAAEDAGRALIDALHDEWRVDQRRGEAVPIWAEAAGADEAASAVRYAEWLMDHDRKSPALKNLQGLIWEGGYRAGELRGEVFPDVPVALGQWAESRIDVAIYSSGSILAQKLLFGSNNECDLTPLIKAYFDTGVGPKTSPQSYTRIAEQMEHPPDAIVFVSDVAAELIAAKAAGLQIALSVRPGNAEQTIDAAVPRVSALTDLVAQPAGAH